MSSLLRIIFDPDATPPSVPALSSPVVVGQDRLDLSWTTAVDTGGSGLAGYEILKDGTTVIQLGVQTSYSDTGLAAGSTHTYRVRSYDGAGNRSAYSSQVSATTAAAPAPYSPAFPRLGSYAIGGQQLATVDTLRRRHVNIVAHYPGWEQSKGTSLNSLFAQVKAASTIGTKCFAYIIYSDLSKASANDGAAYREVYDYAQANNLWAYTNGLTETGQLDSQFNPPNYHKLNYTSNGKLVSGKNFGQWFIDWATRLNKTGGTFSLGTSTRTVTPNTNIDGLFVDNVFYAERVNADYDRNGSLDGLTSASSMSYIQNSHAALAAYLRTLWPNSPLLANSADWIEYELAGHGLISATPLAQVYEGGVIETVQNYEVANHFLRAMNVIKVQMENYRAPKLGVVEVNIASATDYRFMRYWLGICLLTDTYYYPNLGSYSTQDLPSLWFDEFNFNLGAATEPVQTAPRYNTVGTSGTTGEGVWRRDFANGIVLVGARRSSGGSVSTGPNGDQTTPYATVSLGGTFYRLVGTQDAAINNGTAVTSISLRPRDAIVLSRTPVDQTAPSVPGTLSATVASSTQINLNWNASTDTGGSGLAGYKVERSLNGSTGWTQIATPTVTTLSDTGLSASTQYFYRVRAYDNAQNHSGYSNTATAMTQGGAGTVIFGPDDFASATVTTSGTATRTQMLARGYSEVNLNLGACRIQTWPLDSGLKCFMMEYTVDQATDDVRLTLPANTTHIIVEWDEIRSANFDFANMKDFRLPCFLTTNGSDTINVDCYSGYEASPRTSGIDPSATAGFWIQGPDRNPALGGTGQVVGGSFNFVRGVEYHITYELKFNSPNTSDGIVRFIHHNKQTNVTTTFQTTTAKLSRDGIGQCVIRRVQWGMDATTGGLGFAGESKMYRRNMKVTRIA